MDFEKIYCEYFRDIYLYVRSFTADEVLAEEVTQDTFVKALQSIDRFDGSQNIRAWLFTIARNTYFTVLRQQRHFTGKTNEDPFLPLPHTEADIGVTLVNKEQHLAVHGFLHTMDEPYKEVFYLRVFGELPFESIGLLFGRSASWARVTFYRARKKIIEFLEEEDYE